MKPVVIAIVTLVVVVSLAAAGPRFNRTIFLPDGTRQIISVEQGRIHRIVKDSLRVEYGGYQQWFVISQNMSVLDASKPILTIPPVNAPMKEGDYVETGGYRGRIIVLVRTVAQPAPGSTPPSTSQP
jgi:hypothetical protein